MDDMEENSEKKRMIGICERWVGIAKDSETIKKIYSVMDTIGGTTLLKYVNEADEFLKSIKQTREVKEIREYVKQDRKEIDRGLSLF